MRKELAVWRSPNGGSRSVPIGSRSRRESPTGYSSAGCSPAEPASARPGFGSDRQSAGPLLPEACHLYFARRVTFQSCADSCNMPQVLAGGLSPLSR